ncbi:MAG: hypothetical protein ACRD4S_13750 [Candidatus Acidiferrales bacterium]
MMKRFAVAILLLSSFAWVSLPSFAQDASASAKASSVSQSVTGCLKQGIERGHYTVTGDDGITWLLRSNKIDVESHVGQTVKVTGKVLQRQPLPRDEQAHPGTSGREMVSHTVNHHLFVTQLTTISDSCQTSK